MTQNEIVKLENEVMALTRKVEAVLKSVDKCQRQDRDYAGTLRLNAIAANRQLTELCNLLNDKFGFGEVQK